MDSLMVVATVTQVVSSMVAAVAALEQASRNLGEAPERIQSLEDLVHQLETLSGQLKQKHVYKLHDPQLDHKIRSLNSLIQRLRPKVNMARRTLSGSKYKFKYMAVVVWNSLVGDPVGKLADSIRDDLNWWLESQSTNLNVEKEIESTAQDVPAVLPLKIKTDEKGCSIPYEAEIVKGLLEQEGSHPVVVIVGPSGMGKSTLARQVLSDPPPRFVDGAVELRFGEWCSRSACNGNEAEYQKRLAGKLHKFLVMIGFWEKNMDEHGEDLGQICLLLQEALCRKSILILLDDVWEQDIVESFTKLCDNDCKYLVTARNIAFVCKITEAEIVELSKDEAHNLLDEEKLQVYIE